MSFLEFLKPCLRWHYVAVDVIKSKSCHTLGYNIMSFICLNIFQTFFLLGLVSHLVKKTTKVSKECFLELDCGDECKTGDERKSSRVKWDTVQVGTVDCRSFSGITDAKESNTIRNNKCHHKTDIACETGNSVAQ